MNTVAEPAAGASAPAPGLGGNVTVETRARRRLTGLTMVAPMLIVVLVFMGLSLIHI